MKSVSFIINEFCAFLVFHFFCLLGENFVSSFFFIAAGVMMAQYEFCVDTFSQCPTPMAVGPKGTGKTTASKALLSLFGLMNKNLVGKMTEAEASEHCSKSSFPYVYDDPQNLTEVKKLINATFNGQARVTSRSSFTPKTGVMLSLNERKLPNLLKDFQ